MGAKSSKQDSRRQEGQARVRKSIPGSAAGHNLERSVNGSNQTKSAVSKSRPVQQPERSQENSGNGNLAKITSQILTGSTYQAEALFFQYDKDRDGFLSPAEVNDGLSTWGLDLQPDMFSQFVEVNFLYSDRDQDGLLSLIEWIQLFKLMSESSINGGGAKVGNKFSKEDTEQTGLINKAAFAKIVDGLNLKLSPAMQKNYIDVNWRFVDRALQGRISFGQFLSCYANFLYSYEISQGMRRQRLKV